MELLVRNGLNQSTYRSQNISKSILWRFSWRIYGDKTDKLTGYRQRESIPTKVGLVSLCISPEFLSASFMEDLMIKLIWSVMV